MRRQGIIIAVVLALFIAGLVLINWPAKHSYKIPTDIKSKLSFPVLFLQDPAAKNISLSSSSIKYSAAGGTPVFSFIVNDISQQVTLTEQAYPDVLIYDSLINGIQSYSSAGTIYGNASLGRPKDGGGGQLAVLKYSNSTLVFAKPSTDLSETQWTALFNSLTPVQ